MGTWFSFEAGVGVWQAGEDPGRPESAVKQGDRFTGGDRRNLTALGGGRGKREDAKCSMKEEKIPCQGKESTHFHSRKRTRQATAGGIFEFQEKTRKPRVKLQSVRKGGGKRTTPGSLREKDGTQVTTRGRGNKGAHQRVRGEMSHIAAQLLKRKTKERLKNPSEE